MGELVAALSDNDPDTSYRSRLGVKHGLGKPEKTELLMESRGYFLALDKAVPTAAFFRPRPCPIVALLKPLTHVHQTFSRGCIEGGVML